MSNSKRRSDSEGVDESFWDGHHIVIEIICAKCKEDAWCVYLCVLVCVRGAFMCVCVGEDHE